MTSDITRRWRLVPVLAAVAVLAACGGGDDNDPPQLSAATGAALKGDCTALAARLTGLANTTITGTSRVAAGTLTVGGAPVREHCLVTGRMNQRVSPVDGNTYAINFEMRLPTAWNGRFLHQGNGGIDGAVVEASGGFGTGKSNALAQGFAVLSSDAGHPGNLGPNFGVDPQARLDYGYQAVGKLTPVAKRVITAAYDKGPDRSYFAGCSNGGRHAMVTASRYAADYDGILAGAPGYNLPKAALANIAGAQLYASVASNPMDISTGFTEAERKTVASAVLGKCDSLDGATDGLVQDIAACRSAFSLQRDVPTCTGARDGSCLTGAQKTAIGKIFSGPTTSKGDKIYASFPYDGGLAQGGNPFWEFIAPVFLDSGAVGIIFKVPPADPATFNGPAFALGADLDALSEAILAKNTLYTESSMSFMTPPNPTDMSALKKRGGKIMVVHGVSDPIFSYDDSEAWYRGLDRNHEGRAGDFARLYPVPGMGHCSGGPSTDQYDALGALVAWVEKGDEPIAIVASARGGTAPGSNAEVPAGWSADRTRPLCPFPLVARYNGSGSIESAASFSCK